MSKMSERLKKPFAESDIEWRVCRSGITNDRPWIMCLCYVTNRAIMDRLDEVIGAENWQNEFKQAPEGGILCGISLRLYALDKRKDEDISVEWVTKWDGAENTDVEAVKGGLSSSMKRAAVQWGIGRYLYKLEENFAIISDSGEFKARVKDKKSGEYRNVRWSPPDLPEWAVKPEGDSKSAKRKKASGDAKIDAKKTIESNTPDVKSEADYGFKEEDVKSDQRNVIAEGVKSPQRTLIPNTLPSMVDQSLDEILSNPPKPVEQDKKQMMISKIIKMSANMKSQDYEVFKTNRVGDRGLVYLTDNELIKFGTELRDHLSEQKN